MAILTYQAPKRRSVFPKSSLIRPDLIRDGNLADKTQAVEDGEFVIVANTGNSEVPALLAGEQTDTLSFHDSAPSTNGNNLYQAKSVLDRHGLGLRMVWGHPLRADIQGNMKTRVPFFDREIDVEVALFNAISGLSLRSQFVPGSYVTVAPNYAAIQGGDAGSRLVLHPTYIATAAEQDPAVIGAAAADDAVDAYQGWVVGQVKRAPNELPVNGSKIVVRLFNEPRLIGA